MFNITLQVAAHPDHGQRTRQVVSRAVLYLLLAVGAFIFSVPMLWMISASFMSTAELFSTETRFLPSSLRFDNYIEVFTSFNFARYLLNSIIVTGGIILLNLIFCPLVGYSLAKFRYPGRNLLFMFILATVMVPFTAIVIPLYLTVRSLGWINTYQAMIAPFAMSAFGIFLMRQFMHAIPDDYIDAARIDGASEIAIYLRIVLPISQPALVTLALITFIGSWDELLWPLIVTNSEALRTLPIGLTKFVEAYQTRWDLMMAGSVVAALPAVLVFLMMQNRFLAGMASLSGLK
ncbi:MAG: carbohydrate ABC transporter permease [Anaerolineae bacterium]|nr:carbohydrate ABC transporter permease [Anaerolineae bacterium]